MNLISFLIERKFVEHEHLIEKLYSDFSEAFNMVSHEILIQKMAKHGMDYINFG